jgi:hypothetical protein
VRQQVDRVVLAGLGEMHDPNAIDTLRFATLVGFRWEAVSKPRRRRPEDPAG